MSGGMSPEDLVNLLDDVFIMMDNLAEQHRIEKIKTIGLLACFLHVLSSSLSLSLSLSFSLRVCVCVCLEDKQSVF